MLSLATNPAALLMDDEMNVLPTSSHVRSIKALPRDEDGSVILPGPATANASELADLVASLADTQVGHKTPNLIRPVSPLPTAPSSLPASHAHTPSSTFPVPCNRRGP